MTRYFFITLFFLTIFNLNVFARSKKSNTNTRYEYQKIQNVDLGALDLKGSVISTSDISLSIRSKIKFKSSVKTKRNFDREIELDFDELH